MSDEIAVELARQEGSEFRSVRLTLEADGTLMLDAQDMGPSVKEFWGDSDYEFWVRVPQDALATLAFELLREKYAGRLGAVDEFDDWCAAHAIRHERGSYA